VRFDLPLSVSLRTAGNDKKVKTAKNFGDSGKNEFSVSDRIKNLFNGLGGGSIHYSGKEIVTGDKAGFGYNKELPA
jgi:hypothetical protein